MITLEKVAQFVGGVLVGKADYPIEGIGALDSAGPEQLTFLADPKRLGKIHTTRAGAILIRKEVEGGPANRIEVEDPYWAYARATALFAPGPKAEPGIHAAAIVHPTARVAADARVGPFCVVGVHAMVGERSVLGAHTVVGDNAAVGRDCLLHARVAVGRDCRLGDRVIVHSGAVIGSDGFGFAEKNGSYTKIHQLGHVEIGNDVEIGANCCIDRGALGATVLGNGVKLDNLVHIAHNVVVEENTAMAAQVGVSGSTKIGKNVKIGGQAGFAGHLVVGAGAFIGAQAGVSKSVAGGAKITGTPARDIAQVRRSEAALYSLPQYLETIRKRGKAQP